MPDDVDDEIYAIKYAHLFRHSAPGLEGIAVRLDADPLTP
jgi:hypothetical protein